jgi:hypothetical protein
MYLAMVAGVRRARRGSARLAATVLYQFEI